MYVDNFQFFFCTSYIHIYVDYMPTLHRYVLGIFIYLFQTRYDTNVANAYANFIEAIIDTCAIGLVLIWSLIKYNSL